MVFLELWLVVEVLAGEFLLASILGIHGFLATYVLNRIVGYRMDI